MNLISKIVSTQGTQETRGTQETQETQRSYTQAHRHADRQTYIDTGQVVS